jgi:YMGG-like Gly-zipper
VFTASTLSTKSNKTGEPFTGTLATAIVDGDWVIAQRGAAIGGVIVNSDPGGRVKGVASMTIKLNRLTLADGRTIPISTSSYVTKARTTKKKDAKKIGIGAGAGAVIGAIAGGGKGAAIGAGVGGGAGTAVALSTRGDPAVIPGESKLSFRLASAVKITQR